ncbi:unnamed protein product [Bemisia tabaci]|uniref:Uncharacterized protein n=1 Tax=Bemisia tabaci TaxID=7038 RepID=A0A9P0CAF7_BEMTA|nr:unnamed protein product [Bemisia tabaci]
MPGRWESSGRPLFVRTVWIKGIRHVVLSKNDPLLREMVPDIPFRAGHVSAPTSEPALLPSPISAPSMTSACSSALTSSTEPLPESFAEPVSENRARAGRRGGLSQNEQGQKVLLARTNAVGRVGAGPAALPPDRRGASDGGAEPALGPRHEVAGPVGEEPPGDDDGRRAGEGEAVAGRETREEVRQEPERELEHHQHAVRHDVDGRHEDRRQPAAEASPDDPIRAERVGEGYGRQDEQGLRTEKEQLRHPAPRLARLSRALSTDHDRRCDENQASRFRSAHHGDRLPLRRKRGVFLSVL